LLNEKININLLGQQYTFLTEFSEAGEVADILTRKVAEIEKQLGVESKNLNPFVILALAALHISGDYVELKKKHNGLRQNVADWSSALLKNIDAALKNVG
jgi:cell division protein ZapA (FtsZ GTPase activity inhibitor)